jgi:hypothetical protein
MHERMTPALGPASCLCVHTPANRAIHHSTLPKVLMCIAGLWLLAGEGRRLRCDGGVRVAHPARRGGLEGALLPGASMPATCIISAACADIKATLRAYGNPATIHHCGTRLSTWAETLLLQMSLPGEDGADGAGPGGGGGPHGEGLRGGAVLGHGVLLRRRRLLDLVRLLQFVYNGMSKP